MNNKIIKLEVVSYFLLLLGMIAGTIAIALKVGLVVASVIVAFATLVYDKKRVKTKIVIFPLVAFSSYQVAVERSQIPPLVSLFPNILMFIFLVLLSMWIYALNDKK